MAGRMLIIYDLVSKPLQMAVASAYYLDSIQKYLLVGDVHQDILFHPQATGTIAHYYLGYSIHLNGQINQFMPVYGVS